MDPEQAEEMKRKQAAAEKRAAEKKAKAAEGKEETQEEETTSSEDKTLDDEVNEILKKLILRPWSLSQGTFRERNAHVQC